MNDIIFLVSAVLAVPITVFLYHLVARAVKFEEERYAHPIKAPEEIKMISSILTGAPIRTRKGTMLTEAGMQQLAWCNEILRKMGTKNKVVFPTLWEEEKVFTREEVEAHKKLI